MFDESLADESLQKAMVQVEDDMLKARTSEAKEKAMEQVKEIHKVINERIKIQNDRMIAESKNVLDCEKFDSEKEQEEKKRLDEKKSKRVDNCIRVGFRVAEIALVTGTFIVQLANLRNNLIETDNLSKAATRNVLGIIGDYLKGRNF